MFRSSLDFLFFDYFRIPYEVTAARPDPWPQDQGRRHPLRVCEELRWTGAAAPGRALRWPSFQARRSSLQGLVPVAEYRLGATPIFGRVLPDELCGPWLASTGTRWTRSTPIRDRQGGHVASEWRADDGSLFLPYDPDEVINNYWSEGYRDVGASGLGRGIGRAATPLYYRVRPLLPRAGQIWMRRQFSRVQARARFPRWPIETSLHDFYAVLFGHLAAVAGVPVPWLSPWPNGHTWAFVLTHDVETSVGYRHLHLLRDVETEHGYRSSWNFVPRRYTVDRDVVEELQRAQFEVGVHGLYHDGRDLESLAMLSERLPAIRQHADQWRAVGFRSPATHRNWAWMPLLGFDYDSSYPDTDPFEPQSGGCCSWLPYFDHDMVELPITLPQDHTLFVILGERDGRLWSEKAEYLRAQGGMALVLTHPDYMLEDRLIGEYRGLLRRFAGDPTAWRALPRDVSSWWHRRASSRLEPSQQGWRVVGPAAGEARIAYAFPDRR